MQVGVPREVKNREYRVALTPAGVTELVRAGHEVLVERGAGEGSSIPDADFAAAGARIVAAADDVWADADLLLKVKEPVARGVRPAARRARPCSPTCTWPRPRSAPTRWSPRAPRRSPTRPCRPPTARCRCWPRCRRSPAGWRRRWARTAWSGRTAAAACCSAACPACTPPRSSSSAPGCPGMNAAAIALGMQAEVVVLDRDIDKLRAADRIYQGHLQTVASNAYEVERAVLDADLVIGAVLVPGAKAPMLVSNELVSRMKPGSVLVDIAVDQGGCFEDTRPDHPRRPDVPGARVGLLLRGQHARRRAEHLHPRADQRHAALRHGAGQRGDRGGGAPATRRWPTASTSSPARSCCPRSPRRTA